MTKQDTMSVAVVGGGASGTLTTAHLLRASQGADLQVTLHEVSGVPARGAAYSTRDPRHLLNVRAHNMSAYPDDPDHLVRWAAGTGSPVGAHDYLPRMRYAAYLTDVLGAHDDGRLTHVPGQVTDVVAVDGGFEVHADEGVRRVASVVLAYGNLRPRGLSVGDQALPDRPWHLADPWAGRGLDDLSPDATVVVVGTGLTAVDVAITVLHEQPGRRVVMVSRNGRLPLRQLPVPGPAYATAVPDGPITAAGLAEHVRGQVRAAHEQGLDWRPVIDGLREHTQGLWTRLDLEQRRVFLQHHARDWEVHRHRMAPAVADRLDAWLAAGQLEILPGGLLGLEDLGETCRVRAAHLEPFEADVVVNCTGPLTDITSSSDPLVAALLRRGLLVPDPLRLGVHCTPDGDVLDQHGRVVPGLHVVGPPRKGTLYETTAVPEIRIQAAALARRIVAGVRVPA